MTCRKKPGVPFRATVVVAVALVVYPVSFGPACWISQRTGFGGRPIVAIYRPFFSRMLDERSHIRDPLLWYSRLGIASDVWPLLNDDRLIWFSEGPWHTEAPSP